VSVDAGRPVRRVAAIDIGTVTTRLLVADTDGESVSEVSRITTVTQLGEGLHATGALSEAGIERVAAAVAGFVSVVRETGADEVAAVATSAARDAANSDALVARLASLGVTLKVIDGPTEARLSFLGATYGLDGDGILICDLGGGSTELVLGSVHGNGEARSVRIAAGRSLDVGSRRVLDMFLASDPPAANELAAAASWIDTRLRPFLAALPAPVGTLITLAGTGTTLSAIQQGLAVYDPAKVHGTRLTRAKVSELRRILGAMDLASRRRVVGMDPQRANVIVAGALILEAVIELAGVEDTAVSEHDILYGLVLAAATPLA
jgi:exopolyphosphatase/guanosine-5'-triphosphate,3'-diphosphate pyrophosphatase